MGLPQYLRHKGKYARVIFNGREVHLGLYDSPESRMKYDQVVAEWLKNGRRNPIPKRQTSREQQPRFESDERAHTVTSLAVEYFTYARGYYVKNGQPTSEAVGIQLAIRELRKCYADMLADQFGPTHLKAYRQELIDRGLARSSVNKQVGRILRMFRWGVSENLVRPETLTALRSVPGLKAGRCNAREPERVKPVAEEDVEAIRDQLNPVVMAMVDLQRLTGMRPGEVCQLRTGDIDRSGKVWKFRPLNHKVEHHGKDRVIFFGPQAQAVLGPLLRPNEPNRFLFSPVEAERVRRERQRAARKTKVQPSQLSRAKKDPKVHPGDVYTTDSYRRAIASACRKAGIGQWHPNQLRHLAATNLRREFGIEVARAVLGHATVDMTEVYAEQDFAKAMAAMERLG
jgi:integrase